MTMHSVPDCDGKHFCSACKAFLTIDKFEQKGPRRYYCAVHLRSLFRTSGVNELAAT